VAVLNLKNRNYIHKLFNSLLRIARWSFERQLHESFLEYNIGAAQTLKSKWEWEG
jgi:hypothetical protein